MIQTTTIVKCDLCANRLRGEFLAFSRHSLSVCIFKTVEYDNEDEVTYHNDNYIDVCRICAKKISNQLEFIKPA